MHHQLHILRQLYIYMHKQASWQFTYSFTSWKCKWTSAYATCLRKKNLDCLRGCLRTPTRTVKYQVNSLRSCIRSSLEYMRLVIQKKRCSSQSVCVSSWLFPWHPPPSQNSTLRESDMNRSMLGAKSSSDSALDTSADMAPSKILLAHPASKNFGCWTTSFNFKGLCIWGSLTMATNAAFFSRGKLP